MPVLLRWFLNLSVTNPITVRLVQNGSRRPRHFYIRTGYLAMLILVLLWMLLVRTSGGAGPLSYRELAAAGAASFTYVAYLQIGLICLLAPIFMGGAIAQEANPRTWDILLTTPISSLQVVLGNLFGRLFFILALLFASLPLFAITQYFGGVPGSSIFASYLIAASAALLVGAIAIALSVSRLVGKRAFFVFYVCVVTYLAVTAGIDRWMNLAGIGVPGGVTWMTAINPFLTLYALLNPSNYPRAPEGTLGLAGWFLAKPVTTWTVLSLGLSVLLIGASTLTVRLGGLQSLASKTGGVPWYRKMFGLGAAGAEFRPPRSVWGNPVAWREAAARNATFARILARWTFVALGGAFGVMLIVLYHIGTLDNASFRLALATTAWAELGVVSLVAINMAATAVSREREDGTLDLLLTTPITPRDYLNGKLRGLIAYLLPLLAVPLGTLALAGLYTLAGGLGRQGGVIIKTVLPGGVAIDEPVVLPEAAIVAPLVVIPFTAFCVMVGLYWSLRSKGTIGSVVYAVIVVGAVAGIVGLCGWHSGSDLPMLGPALAALSPAAVLNAITAPVSAMGETVTQTGDLLTARVTLVIGALVSAGLYTFVVYMLLGQMVRGFDFTVRKLAGTK